MSKVEKPFKFDISLTILNHLSKNLYKNFNSILGELISNAWDADAVNVWIDVDKNNSCFTFKDDGIGMNRDDFQQKFLKIGYSKRESGNISKLGRPYIGAKGIGKLAVLSIAERVTIISKTKESKIVGGVIDNKELDNVIKDVLIPSSYFLQDLDSSLENNTTFKSGHGTLLVFEGLNNIHINKLDHIRKLLALSYKFSVSGLVGDDNFNIFVNQKKVSVRDLQQLTKNTQFWWSINNFSDDLTNAFKNADHFSLDSRLNIRGFLASVNKPSNLKIFGTGERVTVDLFVNGRLREKNILRHSSTNRIIESYLFGQIHFDEIDSDVHSSVNDPFTSSREGIVDTSEKYRELLIELRKVILTKIHKGWDKLRYYRGEEGDSENTETATTLERAGQTLVVETGNYYQLSDKDSNKEIVNSWIIDLYEDAQFNLASYTHCFLAENLCRKFLEVEGVNISKDSDETLERYKRADSSGKRRLGFRIREHEDDIYFLAMRGLAKNIKSKVGKKFTNSVEDNFDDYHPLRNAVCHTVVLTDSAKKHLKETFKKISINIKNLLSKKRKITF